MDTSHLRLLPAGLTDPPLNVRSQAATRWGSRKLNRCLRTLGVRPKDATVVSGVGGDGQSAVLASVYVVPGADRRTLEGAFTDLDGPPNGTWAPRMIEGQRVMWRAAHGLAAAFWARDGAVYHIGGSEPGFERALTKLLRHSLAVSVT